MDKQCFTTRNEFISNSNVIHSKYVYCDDAIAYVVELALLTSSNFWRLRLGFAVTTATIGHRCKQPWSQRGHLLTVSFSLYCTLLPCRENTFSLDLTRRWIISRQKYSMSELSVACQRPPTDSTLLLACIAVAFFNYLAIVLLLLVGYMTNRRWLQHMNVLVITSIWHQLITIYCNLPPSQLHSFANKIYTN